MSLFHLVEYINSRVDNISCLSIGKIFDSRDHIFTGTEDGHITVIDVLPPQNGVENHEQVVFTHVVGLPVLSIAVDKFLSTFKANLVACLTPKTLILYAPQQNKGGELGLQQVFSHTLLETAYTMITVLPPESITPSILVQGIGASLSIYDGEQCVLSRMLTTSLHPGPVAYCQSSNTIVIGSSATIKSVKYLQLSSHGVGGKKLNFDWSVAVGDIVVGLDVVQLSQPMIIGLCRKRLVALTIAGVLRFSFDLQCIGIALKTYILGTSGSTPYIMSAVTTNMGSILILKDNQLVWTTHTPFIATHIELCDSKDASRLIAIANDKQVCVGYLGTEPSLYRIPIAPNRSVDFTAKKAQMAEYEEEIRKYEGKGVSAGNVNVIREIEATLDRGEMDNPTRAYSKHGDVPSWTVRLNLPSELRDVHININSDLATTTLSYALNNTSGSEQIPLTFFIDDLPPIHPYVTVALHHQSTQVLLETSIPLSLVASVCPVTRQAKHKVTLDTDSSVVELTELLPDIATSTNYATQIGLQIMTTDVIVSVLSAAKSNRYRIQSDSIDYLYLVTSKVIEGIKAKNPNERIDVNFPVSTVVQLAEEYVQLEQKYEKEKEQLAKGVAEVRAMQAVLIPLTRSTKYTPLSNLTLLTETSYNKLLASIDNHSATGNRLNALRRSLSSSLAIMALSNLSQGSVVGIHFYENTQQTLLSRLSWASRDSSQDVSRMILSLLERGGPSRRAITNIEEEEEEEQEENTDFVLGSVPEE